MQRVLIENKDLTNVTWFHPGGSVGVFFQPAHMADLGEYLFDLPEKTQVEVLGSGSNTCFSSGCLDGILAYLGAQFGGFEALSDHTVHVGAGALTDDVVKKAVLHSLDLTVLGAAPGTIGGAIASNAGFIGKSLCDLILRATVVSRDGRIQTLKRDVFEHSDRLAAALRNAVIVQVVLELPQQVSEKPNMALADVKRQHEEMFPTAPLYTGHVFSKKIGNADEAGCKSPTERAAQILRRLEEFRLPGTGLYLDQSFPNIIFSRESFDDLRLAEFARLIANRCRQKFAVDLECNLNIVGDLR